MYSKAKKKNDSMELNIFFQNDIQTMTALSRQIVALFKNNGRPAVGLKCHPCTVLNTIDQPLSLGYCLALLEGDSHRQAYCIG